MNPTSETGTMYELPLQGCTPTPLASYLKALGILRTLAEQSDPDASGCWRNEHFVLNTRLDRDALIEFFLNDWKPTPIIAPWNGGSGFYPKDNRDAMKQIQTSSLPRYADYPPIIELGRETVAEFGLKESPKDKTLKAELLTRLRATLPDAALKWLDAAVTLTTEDTRYPPLLGTGGNDGRLDFTNNYMQRLVDVIPPDRPTAPEQSRRWLMNALFGEAVPGLSGKVIGQFSPGQSGGPNAGTGYEAGALINPWDFVLMIEGSLMFAAAITRRFHDEPGALSFPFTVRPSGAGTGAVSLRDEAPARAEIWMPLWSEPSRLPELKNLFGEGRATLGRRSAVSGLDFSRAVSLLAVNRGIRQFERYAFMMRSGKAYLATPLGRFTVPAKPASDLIADLEQNGNWLKRFQNHARKDETPNRLKTLAYRLENALFALNQRRHERRREVQQVLVILGEIERYAATSPSYRENLRPIPQLGNQWHREARDPSPEFQLASALASLTTGNRKHPMPMRTHIAPENEAGQNWEQGAHKLRAWKHPDVTNNLTDVLATRLRRATQWGLPETPLLGLHGTSAFALDAWLSRQTNDRRLAELTAGLALCDIPRGSGLSTGDDDLPAAYALLKLVFLPESDSGVSLKPAVAQKVLRLLLARRPTEALEIAHEKLRIAGLLDLPSIRVSGVDPLRLAGAMLFPISTKTLSHLKRGLGMESRAQRTA